MTATPLGPQNYYLGKGVVGVITTAPLIQYWVTATAYAIGDQVITFDATAVAPALPLNVYVCTTAGTSGATGGPKGSGTGISDGAGTAIWSSIAFAGVGNVSALSTKLTDTREDHQTSQTGATNTDITFLTKRKGELEFTLEEYTIENLALMAFGTISGTSPARLVKFGGALPANLAVQFVGAGAYGKHFQLIIPRFQLLPDKIDWISAQQAKMSLKADTFGVPNDNFNMYYGAEIA
jgi:hypothetical protein